MTLIVAVVVVVGLYVGRSVLLPITLAVLLSFVLAPLVRLLRRIYLGRILSVFIAVLIALGVIMTLGGLIGTQVAELVQDVPRYTYTIEQKVAALRSVTLDPANQLLKRVTRRNAASVKPEAEKAPESSPEGQAQPPEPKPVPVEVHQPEPTAIDIAARILTPIVDPLFTAAIVLIVATFVLLQREELRDRLIRLFGSADLHRATLAMDDAAQRLSRYFLTQLGINATFGIAIGLGLFMIGVPSPMLCGTVAMLLRFVPYIGAPLAALIPLALAAAVDPGWSSLAWSAGLFIVAELVAGQVMEPLLYGHSTGLSPVSVVVAATFWTWLWGPVGLILSTPLTLCLVVLGRHVKRLEFLDVLLGDRPALSPVESFYQRMLAGDPDEAHDQAEHLLKSSTLLSYYDDVVMKALRLLVEDVVRGVLTVPQIDRIQESIISLIDDLEDHTSLDPSQFKPRSGSTNSMSDATTSEWRAHSADTPSTDLTDRVTAWRSETPVICIAGRGPLDVAAASMLVQLLQKCGIGARVEPYELATRAGIDTLDPTGVAMICLCNVEIVGAPPHVRYALRRLRRQAPQAILMAGFWAGADPVPDEDRLGAAMSVDHCVASLREAVEICLSAAGATGD